MSFLKNVYSIFIKSNPQAFLKDSSAIYSFNFKLHILKQKSGKAIAVKIFANDSSAYKFFPSYKKLYSIDYSSISGSDKEITLVIPLLIFTISSNEIKNGKHSINMQLVMEMLKTFNANPYYDKAIYTGKQSDAQKVFSKITLAAPVIFDYSKMPVAHGPDFIK